jgi:hypothetical protein
MILPSNFDHLGHVCGTNLGSFGELAQTEQMGISQGRLANCNVWFHLRASDVGYLQNCVIDGTIQIKLILNNYGLISLFRLVVNLQSLSQSVNLFHLSYLLRVRSYEAPPLFLLVCFDVLVSFVAS